MTGNPEHSRFTPCSDPRGGEIAGLVTTQPEPSVYAHPWYLLRSDMYGLPSRTNLDFIKGTTLLQACFGPHDLILKFDETVSISIWSSVAVGSLGTNLLRHTRFEEISQAILSLLNRQVLNVGWTPNGTVSLTFEGNDLLEVYDDSASYESYTISSPAGLIVV
jgi:hypothetical protein